MSVFMYPGESGGAYAATGRSNTMAAGLAANSEIFQFRWTAATLFLVTEITLWAGNDGTAFAAGSFLFRASQVRGWTGDGTGGNTSTLTGNNAKMRTSFPTTSIGTIRTADTAALGAGAKTVDANGFCEIGGSITATAGERMISPAGYLIGPARDYPLVLVANEGFVITTVVPAVGTWRFGVSVRGEEAARY